MTPTRPRLPDPGEICSWCATTIAPLAGGERLYVLAVVADEASLEGLGGEYIDYPLAQKTSPALVRAKEEPLVEGARIDCDLVFASCSDRCRTELSLALEADDRVLSVEQWRGGKIEAFTTRDERSIEPSANGRYIVLKVVGDYTRKRAMKHAVEAHAIGRKLGINHYLVDMTESRNTESTLSNYEFAHKDIWEEPAFDKSARVALLVSPDDHSHDFIETVSRNAGLAVKLFTDRALAEKHLSDTR